MHTFTEMPALGDSVSDPCQYFTDPDPTDETKRIRIKLIEKKTDPDPQETYVMKQYTILQNS